MKLLQGLRNLASDPEVALLSLVAGFGTAFVGVGSLVYGPAPGVPSWLPLLAFVLIPFGLWGMELWLSAVGSPATAKEPSRKTPEEG
jgi:hypothetical protein